jgi:hypothetical protein
MVVFALVNRSRVAASFGEEAFFVQMRIGSRWRREKPWYLTEPWYPFEHPVPSSASSACLNFLLPDDQEPGRYRIVLPLTIHIAPGQELRASRSAEFAVR